MHIKKAFDFPKSGYVPDGYRKLFVMGFQYAITGDENHAKEVKEFYEGEKTWNDPGRKWFNYGVSCGEDFILNRFKETCDKLGTNFNFTPYP